MDRNFSRSLAAVLKHEGGFVNHPRDPGGPTNLGITLVNFQRYVKPGGTIDDLKNLTPDQAGVVYRRQYWDAVMASDLPDGVDFAVFDFAVNSGPRRAAQFLQRVLNVKDDGAIGPVTLRAADKMSAAATVTALCDSRMKFLRGLDTFGTFGKGWTRRVSETRALALELADQPPEAERVVVETQVVEKEVPVEVKTVEVPKGADKPGLSRWFGGMSLVGLGSFFTDLPIGLKYGAAAVVILLVIALLWRGEQIAMRAKRVLQSFGD